MKQSTLLKVASQSILKNKLRTLLTMLGIVIGVGAVIVMVAVGNGAQQMIESQISSLGTNLIIVMGSGQAVQRDFAKRVNFGASDPRKDGAAVAELIRFR